MSSPLDVHPRPATRDSQRLWTAGVRREVLPNGLTLLVQQDRSAHAVAVVTHVKAGFFDEPDRWVGVSHVLEHMFFKGTARRGVGAIARETKSAGGYLNASTTYDHTSYYTVLPASGLAAALDIQSDALRNAAIDAGELARELQVIIQEAKRKVDTPSALAHETLHEVMFDRHRIRRWRIGREDQLAAYTRTDLWDYYASRYVPERTIVAIVGDVEPDDALARARDAYGDWAAAAGAVDPSPAEPARRDVRARTLRGDVTQAELALGWRTVAALDPDAVALDLAAAVLGSGRGSRLYRRLREPGTVTWISAHNYAPTELGIMSVTAELAPDRVDDALAGIAEEVTRLALLGPSSEDLERARTLTLGRWAKRMESMEGRAASLAAAEALDGYDFLDREYAALTAVDADQVRAATARWIQPDNVSGVLYLPPEEGKDLTSEKLASIFAVTEIRRTGERAVGRSSSSADRPAARPPVRPSARVIAGVHHTALPGADLLVWRKTGVPLVTLGVYVPRHHLDPAEQAGIGALTARAAVRSAAGLDAAGLAFAFEGLGGSLGTSATSDWLGFGATVLVEHLAEAADLLAGVLTDPLLDDRDIALERGVMEAEAAQVADDMFRFPFQLAFAVGFGETGYGLPVAGLPQTLTRISGADVRSWHRRAFLEVRPVVVAVGDVDPERASEQLSGVFGRLGVLAAGGPLSTVKWVGGNGGPPGRVVPRDKAQAALAMAFPGPSRRDPDHVAAQVWAAVASGLGGRLFEALRDKRSLAYTVMASAWDKARAGALLTYIATSPEREDEARQAMLTELDRFARERVSDTELRQATSYLSGQAEVSRQSGSAIAGEILEAWIAGAGLEELADPGAPYRAVTAEDVHRLASRYLDPARRVEGVVRGGKAVER
jgi:zinc protease